MAMLVSKAVAVPARSCAAHVQVCLPTCGCACLLVCAYMWMYLPTRMRLPHCVHPQVEVMKMLMPLLAPASGVLTFVVPEGAVLGAGDLIGRLELDDPNAVVSESGASAYLCVIMCEHVCVTRID